MRNYKPRIIDSLIEKKLKGKGALLIEGPKWSGKKTSAQQVANSTLDLTNPEDLENNLSLIEINPALLLQGEVPRLIDEWQIAPKLWDAVRFEVDQRSDEGQFILTGSSTPVNSNEITHTGTGRFAWLLMRPMSLYESDDSTGDVSIKQLFNTPDKIAAINSLDIQKIAFLVCRGGWPRSIFLEDDLALEQAYDYYDAIVKMDISKVDGVHRDSERVKQLLRSYARNQGQQVSLKHIRADMLANDTDTLSIDTVSSYINALKKIFVIEESLAWNPNLRSKSAIRTSDTRYFIDPSIGVAALGIGPNDLISDLETFGFLFESLCIRDLRIYAQAINGNVFHYRDKSGLECDAVIHLRNGSYGLVEIKLGGDKLIEEGAQTLMKLNSKLDTNKMKSPSFMMILCGVGNYAYRRKDGIYVVPIGCLKD